MRTKKLILLVLWLVGSAIALPAQWLNEHNMRSTDENESFRSFFRKKTEKARGETFLLPEKGHKYLYYMDKPTHELSFFYDENETLKTEIRTSVTPNPNFMTLQIEYNQTLRIEGIEMPDTMIHYYDAEMTLPIRRTYWNWKLYEVTPIDSFYFEEIIQGWDATNMKWENGKKDYYGFIDTVLWEYNRHRISGSDGAEGWTVVSDRTDSILYDDNGFVTGMIYKSGNSKQKRIYALNEDGSVKRDSLHYYNSEGEEILYRIDEYEWQEWNGYGDMTLTFVAGGDGMYSFFPWMKLRNKLTSRTIYRVDNEGEKTFSSIRKKHWVAPYDSQIDTVFISLDGNPENLYPRTIEENLYDSYGNYILYNNITYTPPDEAGNQALDGAWIDKCYYHYTDYGGYGTGCDTAMAWMSNWLGDDYEMKLQYAEIITQYLGFTAIDEMDDAPNALLISPNPATGAITIAAASEIEQLQIFDITGRLVHSHTSASKEVVFDTGILAKGVYLVRALLKDGGAQTGKVVVQ